MNNSFRTAQIAYDHMEPDIADSERTERAEGEIIAAMRGDYTEQSEMLERLGVSMDEYLTEYEDEYHFAKVYAGSIIAEWDKSEWD